jgi:hypothetical protein
MTTSLRATSIYVAAWFSQMITPNVQAYAIIQPDDNINVMIWPGDNIATVIQNFITG